MDRRSRRSTSYAISFLGRGTGRQGCTLWRPTFDSRNRTLPDALSRTNAKYVSKTANARTTALFLPFRTHSLSGYRHEPIRQPCAHSHCAQGYASRCSARPFVHGVPLHSLVIRLRKKYSGFFLASLGTHMPSGFPYWLVACRQREDCVMRTMRAAANNPARDARGDDNTIFTVTISTI